jgi:hypothetical protein
MCNVFYGQDLGGSLVPDFIHIYERNVAGKFHLEIAWIGAGNVTSMQGKSPRVLVQCAAIHVTNHLQNRMDFMLFPT